MHADQEVVTWTADGAAAHVVRGGRRPGRPAGPRAARARHRRRPAGGDVHVEQRRAPGALPRGAVAWARCCTRSTSGSSRSRSIYVANHAEDQVVIVDNSLAAPFAQLLPHLTTVRHVIVNGPVPGRGAGRPGRCGAADEGVHDYARAAGRRAADRSTGPRWTSDARPRCATRPARPATPRAWSTRHRSNYLHSMQVACRRRWPCSQGDRLLAVVPMFHANAWGLPYAAIHVRRRR